MRILSGMNTADINDFSGPGEDYKIAGPEDQLEEIIILAYETALDKPLEAIAEQDPQAAVRIDSAGRFRRFFLTAGLT